MPNASIISIASHLPERKLSNEELIEKFPDWDVDKIYKKTGIRERAIVESDQTSLDLAYHSSIKLFQSGVIKPNQIDMILLCTQSPDYFLPSSACILQKRLELPTNCGALDFNLGCSGFIYGLALAKGLIESQQAKNILLITAETYTKYLDPEDRSVRTLFGDGAATTLISSSSTENAIGTPVLGTDGSGAENLIVEGGASRFPDHKPTLKMNGSEILNFTLESIPLCISRLLEQENRTLDSFDYVVFHQANSFILTQLQRKLKIPKNKFCINMQEYGNTVGSTIPMALNRAHLDGEIKSGDEILLCGFGVGYSWGATIIKWP